MSRAKSLVLLTGASGFLGFHILLELLKSGYSVRAAVRSAAKAEKVGSHPLIKAFNLPADALTFVIVPDLTVPGAFDEAVKDVTYIIHVASPTPAFGARDEVPSDELSKVYVDEAVQSYISILESAAKSETKTVKRVVLTSSAVAIVPFPYLAATPGLDYSVQFGPKSRLETPTGPFGSEIEAYSAGKVAALNAAEKWIADRGQAAGFDIVPVLSGWIFGRDEVAETSKDLKVGRTNSVLLGVLLGNKGEWPFNGNAVLVTDVAKVHVKSLDPKIAGNQSFVTSQPIVWEDAVEVVRTEFAADVEAGRLSVEGTQPTQPIDLNGTLTEETFGFKFAPFQEAVRQLAKQYVELETKKE